MENSDAVCYSEAASKINRNPAGTSSYGGLLYGTDTGPVLSDVRYWD